MGHAEMCLAVAGLKEEEVNETTRRLAGVLGPALVTPLAGGPAVGGRGLTRG